jgi:hypothetical protein
MRVLILFVILLSGCGNSAIENVYKNRDSLLDLCKNKALLKSRGNNFWVFKTFYNDRQNEYYVSFEGDSLAFQRDSIQYDADITKGFPHGSDKYKREVCKYILKINKRLASFRIISFRTDFVSLGEPLKLYLDDGTTIVYIPELSKLPNHSNGYKNSLKKINEEWYYTENGI